MMSHQQQLQQQQVGLTCWQTWALPRHQHLHLLLFLLQEQMPCLLGWMLGQ
jgi:hypothetical protein